MITDRDNKFMEIAINEAYEGFRRGDFPVGAVLVIDGKLIGKGSNSTRTNSEWSSHAESSLIRAYAPAIQRNKKNEKIINLYTTLEPCLMCLGTSVLNRVTRIIYACPDPNGGATGLDPIQLSAWYIKKWPIIEQDISFREDSYKTLVEHMRKFDSWERVLKEFEKMHKGW